MDFSEPKARVSKTEHYVLLWDVIYWPSFSGTERLSLRHVAVITRVLSERILLIDHANWPITTMLLREISRDIRVVGICLGSNWA